MPEKPGRKASEKKSKTKKKHGVPKEVAQSLMRSLLKVYKRNCLLAGSTPSCELLRAMNKCWENEELLEKFVLFGEPVRSPLDAGRPPVGLQELLLAMRQAGYVHMRALYVCNVPLQHQQVSALGVLLEKGIHPIHKIELTDCLLEHYSMQRLFVSFTPCHVLTIVNVDYNEFGDDGCAGLCAGLRANVTVTSLSLCYCGLTVASGKILGNMVATSAVRDLYADGNDLECEGAMDLIKLCADQAETEAVEKENAAQLKLEEEAAKAELRGYVFTKENKPQSASATSKKKKKGKRKGKNPPSPPRVGPWIHKLHLADNGLDAHCVQGAAMPLLCMRLFRKLLGHSDCFEELDLEDNLIGDLGGRELLEALLDRHDAGFRKIKLRTVHRMCTETLGNLIKLGGGLKKKKKKGSKKKKK